MSSLWNKLITLLVPTRRSSAPEVQAKALIKAIDAGGLPLNAARVNDIARRLGLEVSIRASMNDTIERIRRALKR
jgi:hypothetical protein